MKKLTSLFSFRNKANSNHLKLNMDSFSDGQMRSKLWLCDELENALDLSRSYTIWIYGSWYGTLALLFFVREKIKIEKIHLFDIDPEALRVSGKVLNTWDIQGRVEFHQMDCTELKPGDRMFDEKAPDIIINTSCEHFENRQWLEQIPSGTLLAMQSTDMEHPTHIQRMQSLQDFENKMPMGSVAFAGTLDFSYPNFKFKRFMIIGAR